MVFWPKLSLRVQRERSQKHFLFGPKISELGSNLSHLAHQETAPIVIPRLLYGVHFHYEPSPNAPIFFPRIQRKLCQENCTGIFPPSPMTLIFIPRLLLRRSFSLFAFSYSVYFHSMYSPISHISKRRRGKKWHLIKILVIDNNLYLKKLKQNHI